MSHGLRHGLPLAALCLAGCAAVGPNFHPPSPVTPDGFADTARSPPMPPAASSVTMQSEPDPQWWRRFGDPQLESLIERAVAGNLDLEQAVWRIAQARVQEQVAQAAGLPRLTAQASATREQLGLEGILKSKGVYDAVNRLDAPDSPINTLVPGLGANVEQGAKGLLSQITSPINLYQLGFDASWELDLFGRVRRSVEAAGAQTDAAVEVRNDALVSLEAEVAQTYAQLRGAQTLRIIVAEQVAAASLTLELAQSRADAGLDAEADVESARAQLASLQSLGPTFDQQTGVAMNALAVLLGRTPGALDDELAAERALPALPPVVAVGVPATLARRRPDVRAAEAQLHAATAEVGVAVAQLFPDVSLTGQFGLRATQANYLTRWASHFYSFGPSVSLPLFEGGALVGGVRLANVQREQAALSYRKTVLSALQDVDDALVRYRTDQARRDALAITVGANRRAFGLARERWRTGLASFLPVLDAQRQLAANEQQLAQATVQLTTDLIALYKSLGGGWDLGGAPAASVTVAAPG